MALVISIREVAENITVALADALDYIAELSAAKAVNAKAALVTYIDEIKERGETPPTEVLQLKTVITLIEAGYIPARADIVSAPSIGAVANKCRALQKEAEEAAKKKAAEAAKKKAEEVKKANQTSKKKAEEAEKKAEEAKKKAEEAEAAKKKAEEAKKKAEAETLKMVSEALNTIRAAYAAGLLTKKDICGFITK